MTREEAAGVLKNIWIRYISTFDYIESEEADAIDTAIAALRGSQPDPITGLVPCGCGGKAMVWPSDLRRAMVTAYQVGCIKCAMTTVWVRGKQENAENVWNTAMGYPPRPGAIGPDAGEMAPNGEEGARE